MAGTGPSMTFAMRARRRFRPDGTDRPVLPAATVWHLMAETDLRIV
jgi:hypothetical protein